MTTRRFLIVLAGCALAIAPSQACSQRGGQRPPPDGGRLAPGDHEFVIRHDGRRRSYLVHVPPAASDLLPVLLAFHGGGGHAANFQAYAELDQVADREGFLVVYPNGTGVMAGRLLTWNAGDGCCGYALNNRIDDVGFAVAVVDDLADRIAVDRARIYATGHSNGGILSHRLAAERPGFVAAIAPVAGALDLARFAPTVAVPVLQIHSVDDPRAPYDGGLGPPFPGTNSRVQHQPVQTGLDRWIAANGCSSRADTVESRRGTRQTGGTDQAAILIAWRACRGGGEVRHWKLSGSGHAWPGDARPPGGERLAGPQTTLIRAGEEVWSFVSRYRR